MNNNNNEIIKRINEIKTKIYNFTGRADDYKIIAVTKTVPVEKILMLGGSDINDIGENRVQEIKNKNLQNLSDFSIHMIGQLQTNKVKYIMDSVAMIHSVDRIALVDEINRRALAVNKRMPVLIQINISGESTKSGVELERARYMVEQAAAREGILVSGIMTVLPQSGNPDELRPLMRSMRGLFDDLRSSNIAGTDIRYLSMGMSGDYLQCLDEGANIIRLGSAIFGEREYHA